MKAALYHAFGEPLAIETVPDPSPPADGVVLRVLANGVCRSDWHGWMGHDPDIQSLPHVPGHELCGIVEAAGPEVRRVKPGDRVILPVVSGCGRCPDCLGGDHQVCARQFQPGFTGWGAFAQYVAAPYADANLVTVPDGIGDLAAAAIGCRVTTAFRVVVEQGRVSAGQWVAIHACGGVGLSAVMIAAACGAGVVAIDRDPRKLEIARELGAAATIDASAVNDVPQAVMEATSGGAHLSVDALGSPQTCRNSVLSLRRRGRHVQVGLMLAGDQDTPLPLDRMVAWELEIVGSHAMAAHRFEGLLAMVEQGRIDPARLVHRTVDLAEGAKVLERLNDFQELGFTVIDRFD
jgi:alcohol dehydrogenase